jgi:hypothetical protein
LHELEQTYQHDGHRRDKQAPMRKRKADGDANQDEGKGVFTVLPKRGVRAIARRPERREHDRRDQDEGGQAEEIPHRQRIA